MKIEDYIVVFDDALTPQFCDDMVALFEKEKDRVVRNNDLMKFSEINILTCNAFDAVKSEFIEKMVKCQLAYKNQVKAYIWPEKPLYEAPRIKKYEKEKGFFDWHVDAADVDTSKRLLVMFWYLNDVESGGETLFVVNEEFLRVAPKKGRVVCFPPNFMFPHKGAVPHSGPKYVISSYVQHVANDGFQVYKKDGKYSTPGW